MNRMAKVFITGGAGFIGAAVACQCVREGMDVVTYDIVSPTETIGTHVTGTIMFPEELFHAMKGADYVIHLAAMLGVQRTETHRTECLSINIEGTKNVFESCVKAGIKKIVFASSSEVYGEPQKNPISELDPVMPKSVYAATKLVGEEYARAYRNEYGLEFSIARFFNAYGPGQVAEFVLPRFIRSVMRGEAPTVYGDGGQIRSFCHVADTAQGVLLALTKNEANGEIFNIGNDQTAVSMLELANTAINVSGNNNLKPRLVPMADADRTQAREILRRTADITKARTLLGYEPRIGLREGIADVIEKNNLKDSWPGYKAAAMA